MKAKLKTSFNYFTAIILIICGVIGWVLPILPGLVFIIIGLIILSIENPRLEKYIEGKLLNYPKIDNVFLAVRQKVKNIFG